MAEKRDALVEAAFQAQRNGNIREYSRLTAEADDLTRELDELEPKAHISESS